MRLLQHQSLTNWVLAQKALLHVAQMLEIIATGGRLKPTYGKDAWPRTPRGRLVDQDRCDGTVTRLPTHYDLLSTLQIAKNALFASQAGIQVAANNIANADTPGYVRENWCRPRSRRNAWGIWSAARACR